MFFSLFLLLSFLSFGFLSLFLFASIYTPRVKLTERKVKHSAPSSGNVKNAVTLSPFFLYATDQEDNMETSIYVSTSLENLGGFFSFLIYTQSVGLLGRRISPSQGRYLHTEQHNTK
jgi:hypothetical protein